MFLFVCLFFLVLFGSGSVNIYIYASDFLLFSTIQGAILVHWGIRQLTLAVQERIFWVFPLFISMGQTQSLCVSCSPWKCWFSLKQHAPGHFFLLPITVCVIYFWMHHLTLHFRYIHFVCFFIILKWRKHKEVCMYLYLAYSETVLKWNVMLKLKKMKGKN